MRLTVRNRIHAPIEQVWKAVTSPAFLAGLAEPLATLETADGSELPPEVRAGDVLRLKVKVARLPLPGTHTIRCAEVDPEAYRLRTEEGSALIRSWRHEIRLRSLGKNTCEYSDRVDVRAGLLTAHVWGFAQLLYRYRQERLKILMLLARA